MSCVILNKYGQITEEVYNTNSKSFDGNRLKN